MKYGIREICDVVLKAKAKMTVGNKIFYKDEPVIYFDSLKTSTMEGAATTVYAQGGRGNSRLIAWEGERTVTFTMEDALISTVGLAILTGADVIESAETKVHVTEIVEIDTLTEVKDNQQKVIGYTIPASIDLEQIAYGDKKPIDTEDYVYVMFLDEAGNVATEPYIYQNTRTEVKEGDKVVDYTFSEKTIVPKRDTETIDFQPKSALVDYYTVKNTGVTQIDITPDKFGGNFYLEASTLFRDTNGTDMPAEFIIPNCKVQSNFTFTMASSGDPSTFTFTMDAFPDYTRWNSTKKVLSAIQIITEEDENTNNIRKTTDAFTDVNGNNKIDVGEEDFGQA